MPQILVFKIQIAFPVVYGNFIAEITLGLKQFRPINNWVFHFLACCLGFILYKWGEKELVNTCILVRIWEYELNTSYTTICNIIEQNNTYRNGWEHEQAFKLALLFGIKSRVYNTTGNERKWIYRTIHSCYYCWLLFCLHLTHNTICWKKIFFQKLRHEKKEQQ